MIKKSIFFLLFCGIIFEPCLAVMIARHNRDFLEAVLQDDLPRTTSLVQKTNPAVDINTRDLHGLTALMYAVAKRSVELVELLINLNAQVNRFRFLNLTIIIVH